MKNKKNSPMKRTKKMKLKSILVIGRRWFDRVNGNTYCSARIYFDGVEVARVPWTYGYGNFYEQAARELIVREKLLPDWRNEKEALFNYCERKGINYMSEHSDGLKRDMIQWGEK